MRRISLRYLSGHKAGQVEVYPISRFESLSLGRDTGCDVRFHPIHDSVVSRNHAVIEWSTDDPPLFRISDLLSSNGTFLNGRRIGRSVLLRAGDQMQFGIGGPIVEFNVERAPDEEDTAERQAVSRQTQEIPAAGTQRGTILKRVS
jgi:pSer/pThr/pTyr-binding forkhead associated (FHA) protein